MARKLTNNRVSDSIYTIGLDVGYGFTKLDGGLDATIMFPSVMSHSRDIKFRASEIAIKYPGDQLEDEDGTWFIGDLAFSQSIEAELMTLRGRTANEETIGNVFRTRLARAAIGKLFPGLRNGEVIHIRLATGLPVDHMRDAAGLKSALIGQHVIKTDSTNFVANVTECMVMPQPYGTIYSRMLKTNGELDPCHTAIRTGVVDIGRYTIDVTLDDNGEYIEPESGSSEGGVFMALERIKTAVNEDFRYTPKDREAEDILRTSCVKVSGETINYQEVVHDALQPVRDATLRLMNARWGTGARVDAIYLSGGGANLVHRDIKSAYRQTVLVDDSQLANARGYRNFALFRQLEG